MSKTQCKQKRYTAPQSPQFKCAKCKRLATDRSQVCKPQKFK